MELPEGKSGQQAHLVEKLQKRAELMGAQKTGNWFVNCETYQAVATFSKCFFYFHLLTHSCHGCSNSVDFLLKYSGLPILRTLISETTKDF